MNVFNDFTDRIKKIVQAIAGSAVTDSDLARIVVETPREAGHGDLACNAAMVLAKPLAMKPRELATRIAASLASDPDVDAAEVAGPGFINLRLRMPYWHRALGALIAAGAEYGRSNLGKGEPVNVEYVSANPTGPMHVGHARGAVFGDSLANLLAAAGFAVTREYYINDGGAQVDRLARSAYLRYREAVGEDIGEIPEGLYPGDYLVPVGKALAEEYGRTLLDEAEERWLPLVRDFTVARMMDLIREDLVALGIRHEVFSSERALSDPVNGGPSRVQSALATLEAKGLLYRGILEPPKGKLLEDWEPREQTLFRATAFGDDIDRPLLKSDGSYTYLTPDIAYHHDKFLRGFRDMIVVVGADHAGYVKRLKAAVAAVTDNQARIDVKLCQLVKLYRGGEPYKMSKRAGDFITVREVVDEVDRDPVRFMMVFRKNDAPLDFDFEKVKEQSKDNPVFYVQYAHARTASIFRQAEAEMPGLKPDLAALSAAAFDRLADQGEMGLIRRLAEYPKVLEAAAEAHEPHRVAFYLYELASDFHGHWNRGKELPQLRFINQTDPDSTLARLALVHATKLVLSSGLAILGVGAPEEMR
ncbi:MAG TPA: arginine--tRNA ligase [Bauldia sp.]|nr:arginine--tRNA ligase [Bauldia sp.]